MQLFYDIVDAPLYGSFKLGENPYSAVRALRTHQGTLDRYCTFCGRESTWTATRTDAVRQMVVNGVTNSHWLNGAELLLVCSRNAKHKARYFLHFILIDPDDEDAAHNILLTKVGQYPSLTDFQIGDLKDFEIALDSQQRREFVQAINTSAHGFSVASCVYYRRIFEQLIDDARDEWAKETGQTDLAAFNNKYTDEKIKVLGVNYLPEFLVEHPHLYGILSKGVHQLSEEECKEKLPTIRQAIEIILQEKAASISAKKRKQQASHLLAKAVTKSK